MKKKILLNGMEFMAQPVCFLIPEAMGPEDNFVRDFLNENEYLYGKFMPHRSTGQSPDNFPCVINLRGKVIEYIPIDHTFNYLFDGFQAVGYNYYFEGLRLTLLTEWVDIYNNPSNLLAEQ